MEVHIHTGKGRAQKAGKHALQANPIVNVGKDVEAPWVRDGYERAFDTTHPGGCYRPAPRWMAAVLNSTTPAEAVAVLPEGSPLVGQMGGVVEVRGWRGVDSVLLFNDSSRRPAALCRQERHHFTVYHCWRKYKETRRKHVIPVMACFPRPS
eukprot:Sspe_Gene.71448::Locus_42363_Transcript_1_1_Confidence_1.000_Length_480::g.71448::m.71448